MLECEINVYGRQTNFKQNWKKLFSSIIKTICKFVKYGKRKAAASAAAKDALLLAEGLAVGALVNSGIGLVGAYKNTIQRTEVFGVAVIGALLNGAFDALVGVAAHNNSSFF